MPAGYALQHAFFITANIFKSTFFFYGHSFYFKIPGNAHPVYKKIGNNSVIV